MCRSPIAPARIEGSAAALLSPPGGTMSGFETSSKWQLVSSTPAPASDAALTHTRRERRSRGPIMSCRMAIMAPSRSEGDVDAADEVAHRRLRQEIGRGEVVLTGLVQLGVDTLVFRPRGEIASHHRKAQVAGAEELRPARRSEIRHRDLTQLGEGAILDVTSLRAFEVGGSGRLLLERRGAIVQPAAVVARRQTAELLGAVEQLVAEPAVEQAIQAHVPLNRDIEGQADPVIGERLAHEDGGAAERHFTGIDDPVAVRVAERITRHEVATQGVSRLMTL